MAADETTERRFRVFRVLFYLTGNPILNTTTPSKAYLAYSVVIVTCVFVTSLTMILEPLMNLNDIEHYMQSARVVVPMFICIWIHILRSGEGLSEGRGGGTRGLKLKGYLNFKSSW
jgi:hypothetical protein